MRSRICISSSVIEDDRFLALNLGAQILYIHLLTSANVTGRILGARRLARSYSLEDALDELIDNGYIIVVDGATFDRFSWVNNKFASRQFDQMKECPEYQSGKLAFEGVVGKSPYQLATPEQRMSDDCATLGQRSNNDSSRTMQGNASSNASAMDHHPQDNAPDNASAKSNSTPPESPDNQHPCICQKCKNTDARYFIANGITTIICPECGSYEMKR